MTNVTKGLEKSTMTVPVPLPWQDNQPRDVGLPLDHQTTLVVIKQLAQDR